MSLFLKGIQQIRVIGVSRLHNSHVIVGHGKSCRSLAQTRNFQSSMFVAAMNTVNVPAMGDSISEGTVVQILKGPGDYVNVDDIVLVLETDKVSVDVRAAEAGIIVEHFSKLDENVLVGAPLFKVDNSASPPSSSSSKSSSSKSSSTSSSTSSSNMKDDNKESSKVSPSSQGEHGHRTPLIKFLGKRSLLQQQKSNNTTSPRADKKDAQPSSQKTVVKQLKPPTPGVLEFNELPTTFGHLPIRDDEVEAVMSGYSTL